jgi:hypothetical protein
MLMPDGYMRPVDGQPAGVEIAFLTRDVSASFAKAIAEGGFADYCTEANALGA